MSATAALSVSDLSVSYGQEKILDAINFSIREGTTFGLLGLNGAGKTTMIKTILALRTPQNGRVEVFGQEAGNIFVRHETAFLPERFSPSWFLSGMEFLRFSSQLYKRPFDREKALREAEALALAPEALERRVHTYSKGMRQKLGLIATLLTPCRFLILDEPMSGLDPHARALMRKALQNARGQGRTIFFCSHILSDISEICDNIGIMQKGRLIYVGTPAELLKIGGNTDLEKAFLSLVVPQEAALN